MWLRPNRSARWPAGSPLPGPQKSQAPAIPTLPGTAIIVVVPALDRVCWMLSWDDIDGNVSASHIHGPASSSQSAGVLVPLSVNPPFGCTTDSDADAIAANPGNNYVNIHSSTFPGGAIRGQLD